jgi:cation diffusion facilitator family transporter
MLARRDGGEYIRLSLAAAFFAGMSGKRPASHDLTGSPGSSRTVIIAALLGNVLIALGKFVAAAITGSWAMFSEGVHSTVDTGNELLLLYGLRQARRPPDEQFPFGHGKEVYFWSFVVAILIFAGGAGVFVYEGVRGLLQLHPIGHPIASYVVLGLAMLFEGSSWYVGFSAFTRAKGEWGYVEAVQRGKDPSMFVALFEDSAAMLGLLVALTGIVMSLQLGWHRADGMASIVIGLILGGTAVWLAHETKGLLIGESANKPVVDGIRRIASDCAGIERVNEVLTTHMGPDFILLSTSA